MAPSKSRVGGAAVCGVAAVGLVCGFQSSFVSSGAPGARNLRASSYAQVSPQPSPAATSSPIGATSVVATILGACGLAAARRSITRRAMSEAVMGPTSGNGEENIKRPEVVGKSPLFPKYAGSTGGYMSRATKERHAITWTAKTEEWFEMPTGGPALMNAGENLAYFRRKEQCLMVGKQLRKMKIDNYKIYRIDKDGNVTFMHPADGVFPEKVNKGRVQVNGRPFSIGKNPLNSELKGTRFQGKCYEADALTTMFVKARAEAYLDQENLFPLPLINAWAEVEMGPDGERRIKAGSLMPGETASL